LGNIRQLPHVEAVGNESRPSLRARAHIIIYYIYNFIHKWRWQKKQLCCTYNSKYEW